MQSPIRLSVVLVALFAPGVMAQTTNPLDLLKQPVAAAERIPYGTEPLQFGELRVPRGGEDHPVAVLVHGGCWLARLGQIPETVTSWELLRPMAVALEAQGIATWNIEYRRVDNAGGGWPGTFEDVAKATDYLRQLATAHHLDLRRVALIGHSSGGHLALWAAGRHQLATTNPLRGALPLPVAGVVDVDAPPDLETLIPMERQVCGEAIVERLLGGPPSERPTRYHEASATGLLPLGTKQELLIAEKHNGQWINAIQSYGAAAKSAGDQVTVTMMKDAGHFDGVNPQAPAWADVLRSVRSILGQ